MSTSAERLTARGSPFEIVEAVVAGVPCKVFRRAPQTLLDVYRRARACGEREFLATGTHTVTYGEIFRISARMSRAMRRVLGNAAGARIALALDNGPEWIAAFVAVTSMGGTAVALHWASGRREMWAIDMTDCAMVISSEAGAAVLAAHGNRRPVVVVDATGGGVGSAFPSDLIDNAGACGELPFAGNAAVEPDSVAMIAFTSGSTGQPKGVELTHRGMTCGVMNVLLGGALASTRSTELKQAAKPLPPTPFLAGPFSHVSGYGALLLTMYVGGKAVTLGRWDARRCVDLMLSQRATSLIGATAEMLKELLRQEGVTGLGDLLRSVVVQGTALPQNLLRELKSALPNVAIGTGYGLTETNGSVCMGSEAMLHQRPNTSGRPLPTVDLKIRRDDGGEAEPGEAGEVVLRGAMLMRGYANQPDATARVLRDGWLRTGDWGWVDGEGFLYLQDRADRLVACGAVNISCSAIERIIVDNDLADEAFAFGSEERGRTAGLVVVVSRLEAGDSDDAAIIAVLRQEINGSVTPRIVRLAGPFPRTPSGKVDGRELRRLTVGSGGGVLE